MPARYIGRLSASELDFEMTVLSRSKNAASTTLVSYASRFESPPGREPSRSGRLALILDIGGVRAPGGPPGLQNRCAGDELAGGFDSRPPPRIYGLSPLSFKRGAHGRHSGVVRDDFVTSVAT